MLTLQHADVLCNTFARIYLYIISMTHEGSAFSSFHKLVGVKHDALSSRSNIQVKFKSEPKKGLLAAPIEYIGLCSEGRSTNITVSPIAALRNINITQAGYPFHCRICKYYAFCAFGSLASSL